MAAARLSVYRIVKERWASSALSGEGAQKYGGRWNPRGSPCVYLADSRALAALEVLVHLTPLARSLSWRLIEISIPVDLVRTPKLTHLPPNWNRADVTRESQAFGQAWLESNSSAALRLPSSIIEEERVYLFNPLHPDARKARERASTPFSFDNRL